MRDDKGSGIPAPNTTKTSGAVEKVHADKVLFYSLSNSKTMAVTQKGSADPDNQDRDKKNEGSRQEMGKDSRNYSKNLIDDEDDEEEEDAITLELDDDMDEEEGSLDDAEDMTVEFEDTDIDEEDDFIEEGEDMVIEANDKEELANILLDDEDEDDEDLLDEDRQGGRA